MRVVGFVAFLAALFGGFYAAHAALSSRPAPSAGGSALEAALGKVARGISGRPDVHVRCGDTGDPGILGSVAFSDGRPGDEAVLAPKVCATLDGLRRGERPPLPCTRLGAGQCPPRVIALAWAVSALAHESHHLRGVWDEAAATCYGLQSAAFAATSLGAPAAYAAALADYTFWNVRPPREYGYFSPECRDGGTLDLRPETTRFP